MDNIPLTTPYINKTEKMSSLFVDDIKKAPKKTSENKINIEFWGNNFAFFFKFN